MVIVSNKFEGLWAVPIGHPRTCANDAPWLIAEMKLEANPIKIWIRGENTMWFRADQCFVHDRRECLVYQEMHRPHDYAEVKHVQGDGDLGQVDDLLVLLAAVLRATS